MIIDPFGKPMSRGLIWRPQDVDEMFRWYIHWDKGAYGMPKPIHWGRKGEKGITIDPMGPARKWIGRGGRMIAFAVHPCGSTPYLYVLAFWTALPTLLFTPIWPSELDYLIIRVGFSHHKGRRKLIDVWDFEQLERVRKPGLWWIKFSLARLGALALWYIAIADAISGFGINWMSALYQYNGCTDGGKVDMAFSEYGLDGADLNDTIDGYIIPWALEAGGELGRGGEFIGGGNTGVTVNGSLDCQKLVIPGLPEALQPPEASITSSIEDANSGETVAEMPAREVSGGSTASGYYSGYNSGTGPKFYRMKVKGGGNPKAWCKAYGHMNAYSRRDYNAISPNPHVHVKEPNY